MTENAKVFDKIVQERRSMRVFENDDNYDSDIVKRSLERAILSPNSSNMQLWEFIRIRKPEARKKIAGFCMNQSAARTAPELIVFVARPDKFKLSIKHNLALINDKDSFEKEKSKELRKKYYGKLMPVFYSRDFLFLFSLLKKAFVFLVGLKRPIVREVTSINKKVTIHKSVGLAAQTFMLSVKAEGYDTCPMEGFDSKRIKKYLNLPQHAEINMIVAAGKGKEEGIFYPRKRFDYDEVVKTI